MPRIRTIKPEFWSDEKLAPESDAVRLMFLAMLSMADDYGRLLDSPKQIEAFVWPHENRLRHVQRGLDRLTAMGRIERGVTTSGQKVIQVVNWTKHQKVDHPNPKGAFPEIKGNGSRGGGEPIANQSRAASEPFAHNSRLDLGPTTLTYDPDQEPPPTAREVLTSPVEPGTAVGAEWWPDDDTRESIALVFSEIPTKRQATWRHKLTGFLSGLDFPGGKHADPRDVAAGLVAARTMVADIETLTPNYVAGCAVRAEALRLNPGTSTRPAHERGSYMANELAKLEAKKAANAH